MSEKTDKETTNKNLKFEDPTPITIFTNGDPEELVEEKTVENKTPKIEVNLKDNDTVAVFAAGHISQAKWGELSKGYNIIKKEAADYWLAHRTVRLATPEEVAKHYGIK